MIRKFNIGVTASFLCAICLMGCATQQLCPKERSYTLAMQILNAPCEPQSIDKIEKCDDVDTLRIVAFAAHIAAWPMEAGPDTNFDNRLDEVSLVALYRLFYIHSEDSMDALEDYKRAFGIDGARSQFFTEWEEKRKTAIQKEAR